MIVFFLILNSIYAVILINFHLEIGSNMPEIGLASFWTQSFQLSLGNFVTDNFTFEDDTHSFIYIMFYLLWLTYMLMQLIVI